MNHHYPEGWQSINMITNMVLPCNNKDELLAREQHWIDQLPSLFDIGHQYTGGALSRISQKRNPGNRPCIYPANWRAASTTAAGPGPGAGAGAAGAGAAGAGAETT